MLRPRALDHVGILVTDMDRSLRFYQALGMELLHMPRRPGGAAALKIGDKELNVFCNPAAAGAERPQRLDHLCLEMDAATIDEIVAALSEAGLIVASGPAARSDGTALFVHDPDGARIELLVKHER